MLIFGQLWWRNALESHPRMYELMKLLVSFKRGNEERITRMGGGGVKRRSLDQVAGLGYLWNKPCNNAFYNGSEEDKFCTCRHGAPLRSAGEELAEKPVARNEWTANGGGAALCACWVIRGAKRMRLARTDLASTVRHHHSIITNLAISLFRHLVTACPFLEISGQVWACLVQWVQMTWNSPLFKSKLVKTEEAVGPVLDWT